MSRKVELRAKLSSLSQSRKSEPCRSPRPPTATSHNLFEVLEGRQMMAASAGVADGILTVNGTERADRILVEPATRSLTEIVQTINGPRGVTTTQRGLHVKVTDNSGVVRRDVNNQMLDKFFVNSQAISEIRVNAGEGNDSVDTKKTTITSVISLGGGNDSAKTGSGNDIVRGDAGNDDLDAGAGKDQLFGGAGIDILAGVSGEDVLSGGASTDTLNVTFNLGSFVNGRGQSIVRSNEFATTANGVDTMNLKVDLGRFVNDAVLPVIAKVQKVTRNLQPIIDVYNSEVPGVRSMLSNMHATNLPGVPQLLSNLKLSKLLDKDGAFTAFVNVINDVNHLSISTQNGTSLVNLGNYAISSQNGRAKVTRTDTFNPLLSVAPIVNSLNSAGIQFPALNQAETWGRIALGEDVTLVTLDLPKVDAKFDSPSLEMTLPIGTPTPLGPLPIPLDLGVNFDVKVKLGGKIGLDMAGVRSGNYINGFFATPETGGSYTFDVNPSVGTSIAGFGVSLNGTVGGTLKIGLNDPNHDGKVRLSELASGSNPFTLSPEIPFALSVSIDTPAGSLGEWEIVSGVVKL